MFDTRTIIELLVISIVLGLLGALVITPAFDKLRNEPLPTKATIACPVGRNVSVLRDIPAGTFTLTCLDEGETSVFDSE